MITITAKDSRGLSIDCDAIITDPVWPNAPDGMFDIDMAPVDLLAACLENVTAKRVVVVLRFDSDPRFLRSVPARWTYFRTCILPYAVPGYIGRKLGGMEVAYCFGEPVPSKPGRRVIPGMAPSVTKPTPANGHICPRTIEHFRWLVNWFSDPGETVYDPMMGSGTTILACQQMGRNAIGHDINPEYVEIARHRLAVDALCWR